MKNKDYIIIQRIIDYCNDISDLVMEFGDSYEIFTSKYSYQLAINMCIIQIGELASRLSDEIKEVYNIIPWQAVKDMRNFLVHNYGKANLQQSWYTIKNDIPELSVYCKNILIDNGFR